ncbi:hypothetical protein EII14_00510 [Alloprevotella sp. OH1205_COT-284]|uniref:hypothetical protein n=1 Tax=Alloprevotella sp. OH1205_COT-284 TaxID=2491043 RepID=UPI000F603A1C|nr:hypothetical protein [Alloprevotella sp. OH1205_COT-284]RRD80825.1 hypothetical protein EII14_00510 [Alloprevotella sp. OH1205_COT-284]
MKAKLSKSSQSPENQYTFGESKPLVLLSPPFTVAVRDISVFQGSEGKKSHQQIDFQFIRKHFFILPSLAFAQNKLIFRGLPHLAEAVKAKCDHMVYARVRESNCFTIRQEADFSTLELENSNSEVVFLRSEVVVSVCPAQIDIRAGI